MQDIRELYQGGTDGLRKELLDRAVGFEGTALEQLFAKRRADAVARAEKEGTKLEIKETRHIRRNDPCPCGSGVKFKKCCGKRMKKDDTRVAE